ncbi:hypothetical protein D9615_009534 [Tricholomella constricta]|uniref:Uncharacterized protein n=1 Tax=Tricholomella constricta TaxID=117010 RepID=A0A8H5LVS5_9AGAR|nr:hypothetical protein D9615_009534 [Tricholomella constricta]
MPVLSIRFFRHSMTQAMDLNDAVLANIRPASIYFFAHCAHVAPTLRLKQLSVRQHHSLALEPRSSFNGTHSLSANSDMGREPSKRKSEISVAYCLSIFPCEVS